MFAEDTASYGKHSKGKSTKNLPVNEPASVIEQLEKDMKKAAKDLDFERAAVLRDRIAQIKKQLER